MKTAIWGLVLFGSLSFSSFAAAQEALGGPGESCRARADCRAGLKCIDQVCRDENAPPPKSSDDGRPAKKSAISPEALREWMGFKLEGVHPYAGLTWAGGFFTAGVSGNFSGLASNFNQFNGDFIFALNGGVFIDRHQLGVELAPVTYFWTLQRGSPGPAFSITGSYAYFIPLYEGESVKVYWPLRFGVGMIAAPGNNLGGLAFFQPRADLIGTAIQVGHLVIDMHLPTFRYAVTDRSGTQAHLLSWMFGASISYVF